MAHHHAGCRILLDNGAKTRICGVGTCINCWEGKDVDEMERRVKCIYYLTYNGEKDTRNTHLQIFISEYYNIALAINALDIDDSDKSRNYIGRLLIDERSQGKILGEKLEAI